MANTSTHIRQDLKPKASPSMTPVPSPDLQLSMTSITEELFGSKSFSNKRPISRDKTDPATRQDHATKVLTSINSEFSISWIGSGREDLQNT